MSDNTVSNDLLREALLDNIRALAPDDRRRLWEILDDEFGGPSSDDAPVRYRLRETRSDYVAVEYSRAQGTLPTAASSVLISFQAPSRLAHDLQAVALERQISIDTVLNELLSTSLAVLQMDLPSDDDLDSLTVRRELAAASIAALGNVWDNEVDRVWQDFQP